METMYRCCAGLDVHKETVEAQLRRMEAVAADATLGDDDGAVGGDGRVAGWRRSDPRSDGVDGSLLEADL